MPNSMMIPQTATAEHDDSFISDVLLQVERAVRSLAGAADQVVASLVPRQAIPLLFERVDFNARRAEDAMRILRDVSFAPSEPATELSQSLTVVVLVADMVVNGHLSPLALGDGDVFRRNLDRAQYNIRLLRDVYQDVV